MSLIKDLSIQQQARLRQQFESATPFRHLVIEDFFQPEFANQLLDQFPDFDEKLAINEQGVVGNKAVHEKVAGIGKAYRSLDNLVKSEPFLDMVSQITGVPDLKYDPHYFGGGTHENRHGQDLDAHIDFNYHPMTGQHRRLNLIIYLNREWKAEWGGALDLHRDPYLPPYEDEIVRIKPKFNRCVIFETNEHSWHGFERINLPVEKRDLSRKSFALYYYTDSRPEDETAGEHSTIYVERHLPKKFQAGRELSDEDIDQLRILLARRDQHLKRLYGNIRQLYLLLNRGKQPGRPDAGPATEIDSGGLRSGEQISTEEQLGVLQAQALRLEAELSELRASRSWKLTAPLRALARRLRKLQELWKSI